MLFPRGGSSSQARQKSPFPLQATADNLDIPLAPSPYFTSFFFRYFFQIFWLIRCLPLGPLSPACRIPSECPPFVSLIFHQSSFYLSGLFFQLASLCLFPRSRPHVFFFPFHAFLVLFPPHRSSTREIPGYSSPQNRICIPTPPLLPSLSSLPRSTVIVHSLFFVTTTANIVPFLNHASLFPRSLTFFVPLPLHHTISLPVL